MEKVEFNKELWKGCNLCIEACPKKILVVSKERNAKGFSTVECVDQSKCISCTFCAVMCPDLVITVRKGGAS